MQPQGLQPRRWRRADLRQELAFGAGTLVLGNPPYWEAYLKNKREQAKKDGGGR